MRIPLTALALALAAQAAQAKLEIKDVQAAHGQLGPERKALDYLPGDDVYFRFTVTGAKMNAEGRVSGEIHLTLTDAAGKDLVNQMAPVRQALVFGGDRFGAKAVVNLGPQFPTGEYEFTVTYKDLISGESDTFKKKFTVKPTEFALVKVRFSQDKAGTVPAKVGGAVSQTLYLKLDAVGFDRGKGEIDLEMEIRVLDNDRKPVAPQGVRGTAHSEDAEAVKSATHVTFSGELTLTRPGDFVLRVTVTDKHTKKAVTFEAPMRVAE